MARPVARLRGQEVAVVSAADDLVNLLAPILKGAFSDVALVEGSSDLPGTALVTISLSAPALEPVTFVVATTNGTATAGMDYHAQTYTIGISPGSIVATVGVPLIGDSDAEADETFTVTLTPVGGAIDTSSDLTASVTILDDDG